jgi:hypothetical protein
VIGTTGTKDIFGNAVSGAVAVPHVSHATPATVTILDKTAPSVASLNSSTAVYTFELTFTEPVCAADTAALNAALKINNANGITQTAAYTFSGASGTISSFTKLIVAISGVNENHNYSIELLSQGIKDSSGNLLKAFPKTAITVQTSN